MARPLSPREATEMILALRGQGDSAFEYDRRPSRRGRPAAARPVRGASATIAAPAADDAAGSDRVDEKR